MDLSLVPVIIFALFFFVTPNTPSNIQGRTPETYTTENREHRSGKTSFEERAAKRKDQLSNVVNSARKNLKVTLGDLFDEKKEKESRENADKLLKEEEKQLTKKKMQNIKQLFMKE